ncbi:MAG: urease accessory UreF family protein, partial [Paracoccaceae bacterium]
MAMTEARVAKTADLLSLTQWLSPAFPVGGFAYSHGLEQAIAAGDVADAEGLEQWLSVVLDEGSGAVDATLLCLALKGADMADLARALAASKERLAEAETQGAAFAAAVNGISAGDMPKTPL